MAAVASPAVSNLFFHHHRLRRGRATIQVAQRRGDQPWAEPSALRVRLFPLVCATSDDAAAAAESNLTSSALPDMERFSSSTSSGDHYVALFVRLLGLDNDPLDREQAVITLRKYSQGGKKCIDGIMQFPGCINLVVSLLKSESSRTCEAAAGLLRIVSTVSIYRDVIAESGAIEEISSLLCRPSLTSKVKKQSLGTFWNLSIDEKLRMRIAKSDLLPMLVKFLDDKEIKEKEAACGTLANLALSPCLHSLMVEAGVIPKLAVLLKTSNEYYQIVHQEAKTALLELSKDEYYRILIIEEGLVRIPLIGAIEADYVRKSLLQSSQNEQYTLLPWAHGVARLVLILGLEDVSAITKAAHAIADASISEHMRISFKEARALRHLVQLLQHNSEVIREAVAHALDRLSLSHTVRRRIEEDGVLKPLANILKEPNTSDALLEKAVDILSRIFEAGNNIKMEFYNNEAVGGFTKVPDSSSRPEIFKRQMALDSGFIPRLIEILRTSSPSLQVKVSAILEYLVTLETNVAVVAASGIELALDAIFKKCSTSGMTNDMDDWLVQNTIEAEEIGLATAAASRLLAKLLDFDQFCQIIDTKHFTFLLRNILKSSIPLNSKDWVATCLVKLGSKVDKSEHGYPIEMEVTLYATIPRLVEEMNSSFSYQARDVAVKELNKIISEGVMECSKAVAAAGGIFPLVKLVEEASGDALEAGLAVLYNLSMDVENHPAIVATGAVPVLKRIVLTGGPQWPRALHILRTLPT